MKGVNVNDNPQLEKEADLMGEKAKNPNSSELGGNSKAVTQKKENSSTAQLMPALPFISGNGRNYKKFNRKARRSRQQLHREHGIDLPFVDKILNSGNFGLLDTPKHREQFQNALDNILASYEKDVSSFEEKASELKEMAKDAKSEAPFLFKKLTYENRSQMSNYTGFLMRLVDKMSSVKSDYESMTEKKYSNHNGRIKSLRLGTSKPIRAASKLVIQGYPGSAANILTLNSRYVSAYLKVKPYLSKISRLKENLFFMTNHKINQSGQSLEEMEEGVGYERRRLHRGGINEGERYEAYEKRRDYVRGLSRYSRSID